MIESRQPEPFIPITDIWPKDKLTDEILAAYKKMREAGEIRVLKTVYEKCSGRVSIQYLSNAPEEFVHDTLRAQLPNRNPEQMQMQIELKGAPE